jgi:hypothetical protein
MQRDHQQDKDELSGLFSLFTVSSIQRKNRLARNKLFTDRERPPKET